MCIQINFNKHFQMCQLNVFTSVNWRIFPQKIKCRYYTKWAGNNFLGITNSLANSMPYLNEQYFYYFWSAVDTFDFCNTFDITTRGWSIYLSLKASAVHLYNCVVWLYCCQHRHGNPPPGPPERHVEIGVWQVGIRANIEWIKHYPTVFNLIDTIAHTWV